MKLLTIFSIFLLVLMSGAAASGFKKPRKKHHSASSCGQICTGPGDCRSGCTKCQNFVCKGTSETFEPRYIFFDDRFNTALHGSLCLLLCFTMDLLDWILSTIHNFYADTFWDDDIVWEEP
ncbi:hypothetical protein FE257_010612 [Aspergillus nanangensis]|uniref:Uncharacterized protein n=1 Tax=Aspergillus nanangensis TaxID=2582783 RepID=A0AAD4CIB4_ASPNN|nr:hypothetical protein FE257_010612 [Aspergillus nanangensis]